MQREIEHDHRESSFAKQPTPSSPACYTWFKHHASLLHHCSENYSLYIYSKDSSLDWAHLNAVFYKCQGEYFTTQNLQTINLSRSHLWWYLNKMNSVATSITVKLYLFGLFLGCFKGYAITADAENWVVYIYLNFNGISISTINICRSKQHP